jgi:hypothetical protein
MCTLILLRRPGHDWPLLVAANRDEMETRPWRAPGRHWPDRPDVVAGLDELAGGSWLGINDHGVVAAILNRRQSLGPAPGLRSRGELVLEALDHAEAAAAAEALAALEGRAYRRFNLVVADALHAFWIRGDGEDGPRRVAVSPLPSGLTMLTALDPNDGTDPRIARHLPRWRAAATPDPGRQDWSAWETLLASRDGGEDARAAMVFRMPSGFGTVSSALIGMPAPPDRPVFRFAAGPPDRTGWAVLEAGPFPGSVATPPTRAL